MNESESKEVARSKVLSIVLAGLRLRHKLKVCFYRQLCIDEGVESIEGSLEKVAATTQCDKSEFPTVDAFGSDEVISRTKIIDSANGVTRYLYKLSNAHLVGVYGLLLDKKHRLLTHRIGGVSRVALSTPTIIWKSLFASFRKPQRHYPEVYTTHCTNTSNYFHWLLEFLAGLSGYETLRNQIGREIPILLQAPYTSRQRRWLELIGFAYNEVDASWNTHISADTVYFSSNEFSPYCNLDQASCEWLRHKLLSNYQQSSAIDQLPKRLFINRKDTDKDRGISNSEDLEQFMLEHDFTSITISEYSVDEQIALFNNADVIVGEHGAGLANTLFCEDCHLIEIFPCDYHNNDIAVLAMHTNNQYSAVFAYDRDHNVYPNFVNLADLSLALKLDHLKH